MFGSDLAAHPHRCRPLPLDEDALLTPPPIGYMYSIAPCVGQGAYSVSVRKIPVWLNLGGLWLEWRARYGRRAALSAEDCVEERSLIVLGVLE